MSRFMLCLIVLGLFSLDSGYTQTMSVKDSEGHMMMEVNDEGVMGSITLPDTNTALSSETNKLYNLDGSLIWNGTVLGSVVNAGGWTDDGSVVRLTIGTDKVGIGDTSPTHTLDVAGKIGINDNQVLYLPDQSVFTGTMYIGDGGGSLSHTAGSDGELNTAVGFGALNDNTRGYTNTAIGNGALRYNTTGQTNTAVGYRALHLNIGGYVNTAVGNQALYRNVSGNYNTAIGFSANHYNQNGSNNTIIGYAAGSGTEDHDKSGNVFLGFQAGYFETGDNKLYIENSNSEAPLIGGDFSSDRVGINTNAPVATLDVSGTGAIKVPVGETAERPASPAAGMIRLNSETGKFEGYTGSAWVDLH